MVGRQDIKGIHISRTLGAQDYAEVWDSIHVPKDLKESLLCQALLNFTLRAKVSRTVIPLHGIILHRISRINVRTRVAWFRGSVFHAFGL